MLRDAHIRRVTRTFLLALILSLFAVEDTLGQEDGWQLQLPPVERLAAGTIYREDPEGRVYRVTTLSVPADVVMEGAFEYRTKAMTSAKALAAFLKLGEVHGEVGKQVQVDMVMKDVSREITNDVEVDAAIGQFSDDVGIRPNHRYYVIRETRSASEFNVRLAEDVLGEIGWGVSLTKLINRALEAGAAIKQEDQGSLVAKGDYDKRMYIMFLPEEIRQISAGLAGRPPRFGRFSVDRVLDWEPETFSN